LFKTTSAGNKVPSGSFSRAFLAPLLQISDKAVLLPVQPEHVGIMVIPERHDEDNTSAQSLAHFLKYMMESVIEYIHKIIKRKIGR
jgi:hypothetical protein